MRAECAMGGKWRACMVCERHSPPDLIRTQNTSPIDFHRELAPGCSQDKPLMSALPTMVSAHFVKPCLALEDRSRGGVQTATDGGDSRVVSRSTQVQSVLPTAFFGSQPQADLRISEARQLQL